MTDRDLHAVSWFCRLCRILDMPESERPRVPKAKERSEETTAEPEFGCDSDAELPGD